MKFKNYLESVAGINVYPLISLVIFFVFFVVLLVYVMRMDRKSIDEMKSVPLDDSLVKKSILTIVGLLLIPGAYAQSELFDSPYANIYMYLFLFVLGCMILLLVILLAQALTLLNKLSAKAKPEAEKAASTSWFSEGWWSKFGGFATPLSEEEKILITGHDYDGIHELDNRMPPWLQFLFVGTIIFAVGYVLYFHTFEMGNLQEAELQEEIAQAEVQKLAYIEKMGASIDENSVTLLEDESAIKQGGVIFQEKCAACHAADGGGGVGPNLTDEYWIHGGDVKDVFKVIKYGVPEKGMISWEKQLRPADMQKVVSYIVVQLQGTAPAAPKEPQGELMEKTSKAEEAPVALK